MRLSRQPRMTRAEALAAQPVRNMGVEWNEADEGEIRIVVKPRKDHTARILRWFFPPPPERHIILDEVGAEVWRLCDGRTSVEQIIRRMAKRYKLNRKEAETSTTEYLRRLGKK
ncbi:MAG TPA: PqqD family protein, partial [Armatimonadota bacterium]|nr:PqqD family protein [Armatimonadota bacterium]